MLFFQNTAVWVEKNRSRILWLLIAGVLIAGGVYTVLLGDSLRFLPDESDYVQLAVNLSTQRRYTLNGTAPTAFRAPGYPLLLSAILTLGGGIPALRFGNFILLAASLLLVYKILQTQSASFGPLIGVVLVIAYPVLFFTAGALYPQTLGAFLLLLSLYLLQRAPLDARSAAAAGLSLGALVLTIPTFLYSLILIPGWLWLSRRETRARDLGLMVTVAFGMLGLWTARNALALNAFVPLTTNTGENLLYGNSEFTTPNAGTIVDISKYEILAEELSEIGRDQFYRAQALDNIRLDISASLRLYILKTLNYFNFRNSLETQGETSIARDFIMLVSYGLLLGLAILRLLRARSIPLTSFERLLLSFYLLSALVHALFFTRIRFRLPFDYALILLAGLFLGKTLGTRINSPASQAA